MYCVVGLGNLGLSNSMTRHNIGFMAIDMFASELGISFDKYDCEGIVCNFNYNNENILLCKPQTSLNESGVCVKALADRYNLSSNNFIIIYDDKELPVGEIRIRSKGSGGYHNGIRSIIDWFGGNDSFYRIRIGIGKPKDNETLVSYVKCVPPEDEFSLLRQAFFNVKDSILLIVDGKLQVAQNKYNIKGKSRSKPII